MITEEDFKEIEKVIRSNRRGCLCGHRESCSNCDGSDDKERDTLIKKLRERFFGEKKA